MCLACIEYTKGNLTKAEARRGIQEFGGNTHDDKVIEAINSDEIDASEYWPDYAFRNSDDDVA